MIIAGDRVKFNNRYNFPLELTSKEHTVCSVGKMAGQYYVWLYQVPGFFPLNSLELTQRGFMDLYGD